MRLLCIKFIFLIVLFQVNYTIEYRNDYKWAVKFLKKHKKEILRKAESYNTEPDVITSVIFPEILRYSIFRDYFETKGLELIYVDHGKEYADFSIGFFQMKPSFFEKIEEYISCSEDLNYKFRHITEYSGNTEKQIRKERLERLKSFHWQLEYMNCFFLLTEELHSAEWKSKKEKIKFFATAYNHGFYKKRKEIEKWIETAAFPYGVRSKSKQYVYSDISCFFYENSYQEIFK